MPRNDGMIAKLRTGIAAVAKASVGSNLKQLEASGCGITAVGARELQEALVSGSPLVCLKLRDNSIGDGGADILGAALAKGSPLQELNLANNQAISPAEGFVLQS